MSQQIKFGLPHPDVAVAEYLRYRYPNVWCREQTSGPQRLVIAPAENHVELIRALLRELGEPFGILYVLLVSRLGQHQPARYQSPHPLGRSEVLDFLDWFGSYFERDGRHHVWFTSLSDNATLVYDQHDVIFAYGPLDRFERVLAGKGLTRVREVPAYPVPHAHHYNAEFDEDEDRILAHWAWKTFPLEPSDEP